MKAGYIIYNCILRLDACIAVGNNESTNEILNIGFQNYKNIIKTKNIVGFWKIKKK